MMVELCPNSQVSAAGVKEGVKRFSMCGEKDRFGAINIVFVRVVRAADSGCAVLLVLDCRVPGEEKVAGNPPYA